MYYPVSGGKNKMFSISYDPIGTDHIFTLGGKDERYVPQGSQTTWAKSVGGNLWALAVASATFGLESFDFGKPSLQATLSNTIEDFYFPLAFFDEVTNYFIFLYPYFRRNDDQTVSQLGVQVCPTDAPDLVFQVDRDGGEGTFGVLIKASNYLHVDNNSCELRFKPSTTEKIILGGNFFPQYVVSFDPVGAPTNDPSQVSPRIGFDYRIQTPILKSVEGLPRDQI